MMTFETAPQSPGTHLTLDSKPPSVDIAHPGSQLDQSDTFNYCVIF